MDVVVLARGTVALLAGNPRQFELGSVAVQAE